MSDPTNRMIEDMAADLDISEAELDAGLHVPGEDVRAKLRATIARMRAKQKVEPPREDTRLR